LRILITNSDLTQRAGTQLFVRDLALKLLQWGHEPVVHSPTLGDVADELRARTIPVTSDLRTITVAPEVIIGNYHLETMTALQQFRGAPAIFVCHAWQAMPPKFPRIRRYVAVDETCRSHLVYQHGIDPGDIELIFNAIDLERFSARASLPAKPRRAAIFGNEFVEGDTVRAIRGACAEAGIDVSLIGSGLGRNQAEPESFLARYDLVFARARCAIEAMATGAAVILAGPHHMGTMVTTADFDRYRPLNFGRRAMLTPVTIDAVRREIARYDAAEAAEVCRRIRAAASLDLAVAQIMRVAEEVIADVAVDVDAEYAAMANYLRDLEGQFRRASAFSRLRNRVDRWPLIGKLTARLGARLVRALGR
jgi:Glycosyltransferase Family 4